MVDRDGLENRLCRKAYEGSNPSLSAIIVLGIEDNPYISRGVFISNHRRLVLELVLDSPTESPTFVQPGVQPNR